MLKEGIRVFTSDNGTLTDVTLALQDKDETVTLPNVAGDDYIYIAQELPFNGFFLNVSTVNDAASLLTLQYWDGTEWSSHVDLLDDTLASGVTLSKSGNVEFKPDREDTWTLTSDSSETDAPTEIQSVELYDHYWMRIRWSANLNASTALRQITYRFCTDEELIAIDPEINNYLSSWESGKTNWNEQIILASRLVVADLKARGLVVHPGQVLRIEDVHMACAYRTLIVLYEKFGEGFDRNREMAKANYDAFMSNKRFSFDLDRNGLLTPSERFKTVGRLVR